ncbi:phosphoribosyltransferase family protein [Naasia sp. SYSU D00057]|uniref:phosphoribosyltransferase n=1 Tax=Naasia sp. SYSU D00057 TaxID=2817380 RepID=UPI0027DE72F7|nr:phosphoribosyltransferase family protein [Naasia sp. SYSU D00057]
MFRNRQHAGEQLGERIRTLGIRDAVVLGLPRGGVPVAAEVARALAAPLDVILVRKLGSPSNPEYAMGAIGEEGVRVVHPQILEALHVSAEQLAAIERAERVELERRAARYRGGMRPLDLRGRAAVIVDDGIATGSTAEAACEVAASRGAEEIVLATPVAPADWMETLGEHADDFVALETPEAFFAVGQAYAVFDQTSDDEVLAALATRR